MSRRKPFGLILAAFFGIILPMNAQVNLKAGYNISIVSDPGLDQVIETFSLTQPYTSSYKNLGWVHGFEAQGDLNDGSGPYTDKIKLAIHSGAFGYQVTGDLFGMGTDLQFQWYSTKVDLAQNSSTYKDVQEMLALKFYLMLTLQGNGSVDAVLQPYFVLPFKTYDLDPLSQYLNQESGPTGKKWTRFGLTILFYNGEK
jgi:hypothetical protein